MRNRNTRLALTLVMTCAIASCTDPPATGLTPLAPAGNTSANASVPRAASPACQATPASRNWSPATGVPYAIAMNRSADWCGLAIGLLNYDSHSQTPMAEFHVTSAPQHGIVRRRDDHFATHVEYKPDPGFVGEDHFAFRLDPGNGYYPVSVTVREAPPPAGTLPRPHSNAP